MVALGCTGVAVGVDIGVGITAAVVGVTVGRGTETVAVGDTGEDVGPIVGANCVAVGAGSWVGASVLTTEDAVGWTSATSWDVQAISAKTSTKMNRIHFSIKLLTLVTLGSICSSAYY